VDDDKVRELLGRYRPVGPSSDLRERALGASTHPPRTWPWAAAAAALLVATVGLHAATNRAIAAATPPAGQLSVDALAAVMGGTEDARRAAELIVTEQRIRDAMDRRDVNDELEALINATR
jgi:hypothetical protein